MGVEARGGIREGDLSPTGLYVGTDAEVGEPGTVHSLRLRTRDKAIQVEVPGRVVRVVRSDDLLAGTRVRGAAFEFLAYEPGKNEELGALYEHVCAGGDVRGAGAANGPGEDARGSESTGAPEVGVELAALSVETGWPLRKGERVCVEIPCPTGETVRFEGRAKRSHRKPGGSFRTRIAMGCEAAGDDDAEREVTGIRGALQTLPPASARRDRADGRPAPLRPHLSGDLGHIGVTSVLSLIALERFTGELRVQRGEEGARVYVREGQIVDCEGAGPESAPVARIATICVWEEGYFELCLGPVDRPDRVRTSTTALLLDLARAFDEQQVA